MGKRDEEEEGTAVGAHSSLNVILLLFGSAAVRIAGLSLSDLEKSRECTPVSANLHAQ